MAGNLGFGAVASAAVAGGAIPAFSTGANLSGSLGFGAVASGAVAVSGGFVATIPGILAGGNLGFGAVASTAVAGNISSGTVLVPPGGPAVIAAASARALTNASFIAAGSGGPVRASQVVMEVLMPFSGAKLRPFVWINT